LFGILKERVRRRKKKLSPGGGKEKEGRFGIFLLPRMVPMGGGKGRGSRRGGEGSGPPGHSPMEKGGRRGDASLPRVRKKAGKETNPISIT